MGFHVQFEKPDVDVLKEYGRISIAFEVSTEYKIELLNKGLGGMVFHEVKIEQPYIVDFDDEGSPEGWLDRFDLKNWCVISAYEKGERVGGAVVAYDTPNVRVLEGRTDIAVLWDIRVNQEYRRKGVGREIFSKALEWARSKDCKQFKIETQNNNVNACKFYMRQGATLGSIQRYAYFDKPNETGLFWYINF